MENEKKIEDKILDILSKEILSISQLAKKLKMKRYLLSGYLEALKDQGKVESFIVGRAKVYVAKNKIKKSLGILIFISFLPFLLNIGKASIITSFTPSDGEALVLKLNNEIKYSDIISAEIICSDKPNVVIVGEGSNYIPNLLQKQQLLWKFEFPSSLLSKGKYNLTINCNNSEEYLNVEVKFIELFLSSLPSYYENQIIKIDFTLDSDVSLENISILPFINYDKASIILQIKNNVISILISGLPQGEYNFSINLSYSRLNFRFSFPLKILPNYEVKISSISKNMVEKGENITINFVLREKGIPIEASYENVKVYVGDEEAQILALRFDGANNILRVLLPSLSPGKYDLKVVFDSGKIYSDTLPIYYIKPIYGTLLDSNRKPIQAFFYLYKNEQEVYRNNTDSQGNYLIRIVPDTYDLKIVFPQSTLFFKDFSFTGEQNFVNYNYVENIFIEGLKVYALYSFDIIGSYSRVEVNLNYKDYIVEDEDFIRLFYCESWNSQKLSCNKNWVKIDSFDLNKVSNTIFLSLNKLSAFVLGREKYLKVSCNANKNKFYLNDSAIINCLVQDEEGNPVKEAIVTFKMEGKTYVRKTDEKGFVSFDLILDQEGNFTYSINVKKDLYIPSDFNSSILVEKKREIFVLVPDTIRIERGSNLTIDFTIYNIGQADLNDIELFLEGIGFDYTFSQDYLKTLKAGESFKGSLTIYCRENATLGTSSIKFKLNSKEINYSKDIGLTILERKQNLVTGFVIKLPSLKLRKEYLYLIIFAIISFSLSFILKKIKKSRKIKRDYSEIFNLIGGKN
ncbi:MAG: helix-turn-helix domain-containing protein [Candidatus Aenigmatarchaeota archaeon]